MAEISGLTSSQFAKLEGQSNYNDWKFAMRMALIADGLWYVMEEGPPQVEIPEGTNDTSAKKLLEDIKPQQDLYHKRDQKALAKICLMVQPCSYVHVRTAKTAREAWLNLESAYENKGLMHRLTLLRCLVGLKLVNFSSMEAYVSEVMSCAQKLSDMNSPLDDELIAVIMLSGLTTHYDPMVMAIENSKTSLTTDYVKGQLLQDTLLSDTLSF